MILTIMESSLTQFTSLRFLTIAAAYHINRGSEPNGTEQNAQNETVTVRQLFG